MESTLLLLHAESTDSALFARMLYLSLCERGYAVKSVSPTAAVTGEPSAMALLDADVLSDDACHAWAQSRRCIFYTADATRADTLGADVLVRPFAMSALFALLDEPSEASVAPTPVAPVRTPQNPSDELGFSEGVVSFRGVPLSLTARERELLLYLYERRGTVCSRAEILEQVWHYPPDDNKTNVADVYVRYLRAKIDHVFDVRLICAVRRGGYTMR